MNPPPSVSSVHIAVVGIVAFTTASLWPPSLLIIAVILASCLPQLFYERDHAESRRRWVVVVRQPLIRRCSQPESNQCIHCIIPQIVPTVSTPWWFARSNEMSRRRFEGGILGEWQRNGTILIDHEAIRWYSNQSSSFFLPRLPWKFELSHQVWISTTGKRRNRIRRHRLWRARTVRWIARLDPKLGAVGEWFFGVLSGDFEEGISEQAVLSLWGGERQRRLACLVEV